jgi:hypothetical protein
MNILLIALYFLVGIGSGYYIAEDTRSWQGYLGIEDLIMIPLLVLVAPVGLLLALLFKAEKCKWRFFEKKL